MTSMRVFAQALRGLLVAIIVAVCLGAQAPPTSPQAGAPAPAGFQNPVKKALKEGKVVIGTTITTASADVAASAAASGFDFLWIEMEHSPITLESVRNMILATRGLKAVPIVRVPVNEPWLAKRAMDIGAVGVIFPFTANPELAKQAVASCKYPPEGIRGFAPGLAASRWGMTASEYVRWANDNIVVITIIEQKEAVERIEEIAAVPGIDVLFIGANDLSFSLGVGGQLNHPVVQAAVARIVEAARRHNLPLGYPSGSGPEIKKLVAQGFRLFQASSDLGLMQSGARQMLSGIREAAPDKLPATVY
jgi:2-keto-3-deoxy-L-rhamnonate aldolase RhmA